ncbi:MAG: YbaB/EbfC family nucleoid-associated protein [Clostridia bacterium]|nr:YbaB/EbfC family nucleoid-associated protein [Clostridia bacterium]
MKARIPGQAAGGGQMAMMKKIQEMQAQLEEKQAEIEASDFTASSGGGAVEVTVSGAHEVKEIKMQPDVVDPDDIDMLSDLIIAATNEAMRKADDAMEQAMNAAKGGLGGLGLPF